VEFLSSWLKSIILVILLATFVDLLLPNQTMQRYVKTVMSLFILLTLLHPLFALFEKHTQVDELLTAALFKQDNLNGGQTKLVSGQADTLPSIQRQAEELKLRQEQQAHRMVQQQAAELMKRSIEQKIGVKVAQVQVETTTDASGNKIINSVNVHLNGDAKPVSKVEGKGKSSPVASSDPIQPVQPVQIQVATDSISASKSGGAKESKKDTPELEQKRTQVVQLLRSDWQLLDQQVAVEWLEQDRRVKF
jgi:stage III sporulation protein AF